MQLLEDWSQSELIRWVAESDYGYPFILTLHAIGMALVVGIVLILNLRVLGFATKISISSLRMFFKIAWLGLAINVMSGTLLFLANYTAFVHNVAFITKISLLNVGGAATGLLAKELNLSTVIAAGVEMPSRKARVIAGISVVLWLGAITAGRIVGYTSMPE
ncbi:MAG TPA: hypothetical protein VET48_05345 [Steroidobacteraceae bacterium]|nr:hypothetical protein [Steroidobacteraceae bacterium]